MLESWIRYGSPGASAGLMPGKCASLFIQASTSFCLSTSLRWILILHPQTRANISAMGKSQLNCAAHLNKVNNRSFPKRYVVDYTLMQKRQIQWSSFAKIQLHQWVIKDTQQDNSCSIYSEKLPAAVAWNSLTTSSIRGQHLCITC